MAQTQRKQVLGPTGQHDNLISQVNRQTEAIGGTPHGLTKDLTIAGSGFEDVPVNKILPKITGTQQVGQTLTKVPGVWATSRTKAPILTQQWKNAGVNINGATNATYQLQAGDEGDLITVTETATDDLNHAASATSLPTGAIAAA